MYKRQKLSSLPTWWCGHSADRDYVLTHLDELVVRSILPGSPYWEGGRLTAATRVQLNERIQAAPHLFVAQAPALLSTAPVLEDGRLTPRPVMLRGFAVAEDQGLSLIHI